MSHDLTQFELRYSEASPFLRDIVPPVGINARDAGTVPMT